MNKIDIEKTFSGKWHPPVILFHAGRMQVNDSSYYNDSRKLSGPPRILIKRTLSGTGVVYASGKRFLIPSGHVMVIERPGDNIYCYEEHGEPWRFEFVSMTFHNPDGMLPDEFRDNPVFDLGGHHDLSRRLTELIDICSKPGYQPELADSALAYSFFLAYIAARDEQNKVKPPDSVIKLKAVLESDLAEPLELDALAKKFRCRPETLIRNFSASFGLTPIRYRTRVRLRHACVLLSDTGMSIKEIAASCGFDSQEFFSRQFRKYVKVSPGAYRSNPDPLLMIGLQI